MSKITIYTSKTNSFPLLTVFCNCSVLNLQLPVLLSIHRLYGMIVTELGVSTFTQRAGRYRPGEPLFSSPVRPSCRRMEGFLIRGWVLVPPGGAGSTNLRLGFPHRARRYRPRDPRFRLQLVAFVMYRRSSDLGMGRYPLRMALDETHTVRGGIDPWDHRFRSRFVGVVDVRKNF